MSGHISSPPPRPYWAALRMDLFADIRLVGDLVVAEARVIYVGSVSKQALDAWRATWETEQVEQLITSAAAQVEAALSTPR